MVEKRDILWRFLGDAKGLIKASRQAAGDLKDVSKTTTAVERGLTGVQKGFIAAGGAYGAMRAGEWIVDAANLAAQAEIVGESFNKVFGPAADEVRTKLDDMRLSVGLSSAEFEGLLLQNGNLTTGMGFTEEAAAELGTQMFTIAGDMAAFKGDTALTEDALHALNRALVGEFDPLEQFVGGIKASTVAEKALEMGLAETTAELTDQDKATALLALVQENAAKSTGALAEQQGSLQDTTNRANAALADATAQIGQAMTPAVQELADMLAVTATNMVTLSDETSSAGQKFGALANIWDRLVGNVGVQIGEIREEWDMWYGTISRFNDKMNQIGANIREFLKNPFRNWKLPSLSLPSLPSWIPGRAAGGPVESNQAYMVGEKGPEVFVPGRSGAIVPNGSGTSGSGTVVNITIGVAGDPYQTAQAIADLLTRYEQSSGTRISGISL